MAKKDPGRPSQGPLGITKADLLASLRKLDLDPAGRKRVLRMETDFRERIALHVKSHLPKDARFSKFKTNPFVLLIHSMKHGYRHVGQIEQDLLPAKLFSSIETSAGKMIEQVVLPVYGWEYAPSQMHTADSQIDGRQVKKGVLRLATLKSGPQCLNDSTSQNIADSILTHAPKWAKTAGVTEVEFTYGVLYGTKKQSNKKDWHILRNIRDKTPKKLLSVSPDGRWDCRFVKDGVTVTVTVRVGVEWWDYLGGGRQAFFEMAVAVIRACVTPSDTRPEDYEFVIRDLKSIISLDAVPDDYNVSLLQRSQWEWFFFFARHFYDSFEDGGRGTHPEGPARRRRVRGGRSDRGTPNEGGPGQG